MRDVKCPRDLLLSIPSWIVLFIDKKKEEKK